jgi:hypothetical protein
MKSMKEIVATTNQIYQGGTTFTGEKRKAIFPQWIIEVIAIIKTKFPASAEFPWDVADTLSYGRVVERVGEINKTALVQLLRERHTFRPSVAEVKSAVDSITSENAPLLLDGHTVATRRIVRVDRTRQLPTSGESEARRLARQNMPWNRRR